MPKVLTDEDQLIATLRLTRDLRAAASELKEEEARYLVSLYYTLQKLRIASVSQVRAAGDEPNSLLNWTGKMYAQLETDVKQALDVYANGHTVGKWSQSILGIGPVIAAGLIAHIDIKKAPSVGHVWRYAGLDPTTKWLGRNEAPKVVDLALGEPIELDPNEVISSEEIDEILTQRQQDAPLSNPEVVALAQRMNLPIGKIYKEVANDQGNIIPQDVIAHFGLPEDFVISEQRTGGLSHEEVAAVARATNRATPSLYRLASNEYGIVTRASLIKALSKRPWNAELKVLCWKAGQSFVKMSNRDGDYYGHLWKQRKLYETEQNETYSYADQAQRILTEKKIGKETEAYKAYSQGKLPAGHIEARAERWTVKIFLSHWHAVAYEVHHNKPAPTPWVIQFGGHTDVLSVPNWPMEED